LAKATLTHLGWQDAAVDPLSGVRSGCFSDFQNSGTPRSVELLEIHRTQSLTTGLRAAHDSSRDIRAPPKGGSRRRIRRLARKLAKVSFASREK